jgi:hypothetical protein
MVAADARMPDEIVGDNALKMSESLIRPNGGSKVSKQQVRDAVEVRTTRDPPAARAMLFQIATIRSLTTPDLPRPSAADPGLRRQRPDRSDG